MKCTLYAPGDKNPLFEFEATPICGEDFCGTCGECLVCGTEDCDPMGNGGKYSHKWVLYNKNVPAFIEEHEDLDEETKTKLMHAYDGV